MKELPLFKQHIDKCATENDGKLLPAALSPMASTYCWAYRTYHAQYADGNVGRVPPKAAPMMGTTLFLVSFLNNMKTCRPQARSVYGAEPKPAGSERKGLGIPENMVAAACMLDNPNMSPTKLPVTGLQALQAIITGICMVVMVNGGIGI